MARIKLSEHFPEDIVRNIQKIILPNRTMYTFLDQVKEVRYYTVCIICEKIFKSVSLKLLLKLNNFSTKEELVRSKEFTCYCEKCYNIVIMMENIKDKIFCKKKKI